MMRDEESRRCLSCEALARENEELRRKLAEQQAVAVHDIEKLINLGWTPCECDICGSTMASFKAIPKLADALASAKQEGYAQGKKDGRDEVLPELSEQVSTESDIDQATRTT